MFSTENICQEQCSRSWMPFTVRSRVDAVSEASRRMPSRRMPSRRARLHEATATEIKAQARSLMATEGTSSINLRAVARQMGIAPSALYRYFPSRDAILTALVKDAYDAVGEAVEQATGNAPDDDTATAMLAAVHAFRRWALEHPQEYALIYGTPVPDYRAPAAETLEPAMRTNYVLLGQLVKACGRGLVTVPPPESVPEPVRALLRRLSDDEVKGALGLAPEVWAIAMQFWLVLYGAINAEVFGHYPAPFGDDAGLFFDHTMRRALAVIGVKQSSIDAATSPTY
jgi:AcrR family transcriptional regulator